MLEEIVLEDVVETHDHLRADEMAELVTPYSSGYCTALLPMPNVPRLNTIEKVLKNTASVQAIIAQNGHDCEVMPCMMIDQVEVVTTPDMIDEAVDEGINDFKTYFIGTTTGAMGHNAAGVTDLRQMIKVFERIALRNARALFHWELPAPVYFQWRERDAVTVMQWLAKEIPDLNSVAEHITTARMVHAIMNLPPNWTANITPHHMYDTLDIVNGNFLNPFGHCKPPHGTPDDQIAVILAAICGNPKFRFGSDSAPHDETKKICAEGCAGCFTAPTALLMLAEIFSRYLPDELVQQRLQEFVSDRAVAYYGVKKKGKIVRLERTPCTVPAIYRRGDVSLIPYRAGHTFDWRMAA